MAAEMVAGAFLTASFEFLLDKIASPYVAKYLKGKKHSGSDRLLQFKTTFYSLSAVLFDAEQKHIRNPAVKKWLDELQDAVDDAEDLFGEIEYDALKLKVEAAESKTNTSKFSNPFSKFLNSTDHKRKTKMEDILRRLKIFEEQIISLGLVKVVEEKPFPKRESTSLPIESEVYGRNADMDALMEMLMSNDVGSQKICVIPIVGMGGVGKTTLAQAIFNDNKVREMFEPKIWVCVSDQFDAHEVTKTILKAVTSDASIDMDLNSLQVKLKEKLMGKKFLIVLDDVWEVNYVKWEDLMKPFKDGAQGSKIVITTRIKEVAESLGTVQNHHLRELTDEDCWKLFAKHASSGINGDFTLNSELERIGREIVKKCRGLPLAAKALGGVLRSTLDVGRWERIAKSDFWEHTDDKNNILPALKLSYHYLPLHLKRCFAYCSIFPKDHEFEKEDLVLLWMAENLLEQPEKNKRMEEVGEEYFDDLVSRSFFQQLKTNRNASYFVMHDLMVDLAKFVCGRHFCLLLDGSENSDEFVKKTRHLASVMDPYDKRFSCVFEATRLRTLLSLSYSSFSEEVLCNLLLKLKCLRVLSFRRSMIKKLPDSIGELRHLHYLHLSRSFIRMLPESVSMLYNLQTLKLVDCYYLESLPKDMHLLINLRYLDIKRCSKLVEMPRQISKLKNLQMLSTFIVGKDGGTAIEELTKLPCLRGRLLIQKLENVVNITKASGQDNLMDKKHLEKLSLEWSDDYSAVDDPKHVEGVLDMLSPNRVLKELEICNYPGPSFPNWVGDGSFDNIAFVRLEGSRNCHSLPPLGQLHSLKTLIISKFSALVTVGAEFYGNGSAINPFSSLEILNFSFMLSWEKWESMQVEDAGTFGKLRELEISSCNKLIGDLPRFFPSLTKLKISGCERFASPIPTKMPHLRELDFQGFENLESLSEALKPTEEACPQKGPSISDCSSLISIVSLGTTLTPLYHQLESLTLSECGDSFRSLQMDLFNLKTLSIVKCKFFESLSVSDGQSHDLTSLSSLHIHNCPKFVSFPRGGLSAPNLTWLEIDDCRRLKWLPEKMTSLTYLNYLRIVNCPEMETFLEGGLPLSLDRIVISRCDKLLASRVRWNLQTLHNLTTLSILGSSRNEEVEFFPEEGLLPPTITHLFISEFPKLKALDNKGLQQLTSLKELYINDCPDLQTMPEEGLPISLQYLSIKNCPLLEKICQRKKGKYWSKIRRIPIIRVNYKIVE